MGVNKNNPYDGFLLAISYKTAFIGHLSKEIVNINIVDV